MKYGMLAVFVLGASCVVAVHADEVAPAKEADIRELIRMTGASKLAVQMAAMITTAAAADIKKRNPAVPADVIDAINVELVNLFSERMDVPGGLIDRIVPVYDRYLSHEDIRNVIAFYRTPTGQKVINTLPAVMSESGVAGQSWAQSLEPEIQKRIYRVLEQKKVKLTDS